MGSSTGGSPHHGVEDGGWGWFILMGASAGQMIYAGMVLNIGVYLVEWQENFSVGAGAVSVISTELSCGAQIGSMIFTEPITNISRLRSYPTL